MSSETMNSQMGIVNYFLSDAHLERIDKVSSFYLKNANEMKDQKNKNIELEIRLGEYTQNYKSRDTLFTAGVSYDEFSRFFTFLKDNENYKKIDEENYLDINVSLPGMILRITIRSTDQIMNYCNTNLIPLDSEFVTFQMKERVSGITSEISNFDIFNLRLGLAKETTFSNVDEIIQILNGYESRSRRDIFTRESFGKMIYDEMKTYRLKKRISYTCVNYPFRIDLTQTKQYSIDGEIQKERRLSESKLFTQTPIFEVEAEYIPGDMKLSTSRVSDAVVDMMGIMLQIRQDTEFVVDKEDEKRVFKNFMRLYFRKDNVDKEYDMYFNREKQYNKVFPGAKVSTLEIDHLKKITGKPYIYNEYTVTDKADGERHILYISPSDNVYLFNDRLTLIRTNVKLRDFGDTVLDGELIMKEVKGIKTYQYYAFDCLFYRRDNISDLPLIYKSSDRKNDSRRYYLNMVTDAFGDKRNKTYINGVSILDVYAKEYRIINGEDPVRMKQFCDNIWTNRKSKYSYHLDGLIFTPKYDQYPLGRLWANTLKWKPPSENSIDFLIRFSDRDDAIYSKLVDGKVIEYRLAELYCGDNVEKSTTSGRIYKDFVERKFDIPNTLGRDPTYLIRMPMNKDRITLGTRDQLPVRDETIVECVWNSEDGTWQVLRTRLDKTQRYNVSGKRISGTANSFNVAVSIWSTIVNPITEDMIIGKAKVDTAVSAYYSKYGTDYTKPMRSFNNYIKSLLITGARKSGASLLDLSCGRGGDINKWKASNYQRIVGLDFSKNGIENLDPNFGAVGRLLSLKNKGDKWAKSADIRFFWADTSKITTSEYVNGICEDGKKPEAVESLRIPFDVVTSFFTAHYYFENNMKIRGFFQNVHDNLKQDGYVLLTCFDGISVDQLLSNKKQDEVIRGIVEGKTVWEIKKGYRKTLPLVGDKTSVGLKIQVKFESISDDFIPEWLVHHEYLIKIANEYGMKLISDIDATSSFGLPRSTGLFKEVLENLSNDDALEKLEKDETGKMFFRDINELITNGEYASLRQWANQHRYYIFQKSGTTDTTMAKSWRKRLSKYDCNRPYTLEDENTEARESTVVKDAIKEAIPIPEKSDKAEIQILPQIGKETSEVVYLKPDTVVTEAVKPKKRLLKVKPRKEDTSSEDIVSETTNVSQPTIVSEPTIVSQPTNVSETTTVTQPTIDSEIEDILSKEETKKKRILKVKTKTIDESVSKSSSSDSNLVLPTRRKEIEVRTSEEVKKPSRKMFKQTFTLTYGNRAENHKGMQMIGQELDHGLSVEDLLSAKKYFEDKGAKPILVDLNQYLGDVSGSHQVTPARVLIVPGGVSYLMETNDLYEEVDKSPKDTKAFMYGRVVEKRARHNNIFSDFTQEPDYEQGKGTVVDFKDSPLVARIRQAIPEMIPNNPDVVNLQCEGNYYYDVEKTYIGFHGDTEREIVIAVRLGADFNIYYQWFKNSKPVGKLFEYTLSHGDIYFMSEKAVGKDWKKSSQYTLRHAASKNPKLIGLPFEVEDVSEETVTKAKKEKTIKKAVQEEESSKNEKKDEPVATKETKKMKKSVLDLLTKTDETIEKKEEPQQTVKKTIKLKIAKKKDE